MTVKILDTKSVSTADAAVLAKWVYDMTLKGYEPLLLQCARQYGQMVVTMALYDKEKTDGEPTQERSVSDSDSATTTIDGDNGDQGQISGTEADQEGSQPDAESDRSTADTTGQPRSSDQPATDATVDESKAKPKQKRVTKPKAE